MTHHFFVHAGNTFTNSQTCTPYALNCKKHIPERVKPAGHSARQEADLHCSAIIAEPLQPPLPGSPFMQDRKRDRIPIPTDIHVLEHTDQEPRVYGKKH